MVMVFVVLFFFTHLEELLHLRRHAAGALLHFREGLHGDAAELVLLLLEFLLGFRELVLGHFGGFGFHGR